ncbi:haloalkane dehalogenase [Embleya sp. AB8]|uniref:haloalkane dehalogenase n=1 Tax=Embleya sp. AB8 TaxID=3156304 RepID=UPI003C7204B1
MPVIDILDSHIAYTETGEGAPVVFVHGNPTSSHLWRNVTPHVADRARTLAPDLIGMGASGKPDIEYTFADQVRYLDAWIEAMDLPEPVLVGHDWGGVLALDWAARHPSRVRGVALLETMLKPMVSAEVPGPGLARTKAFRTPGVGEELVLEQNIFIETAFKGAVITPVSEADVQPYRDPYPTPESRRPMLAWARMMPIDGEPADVVARITAYDAWLANSPDVPKLLMTFDSAPTLLVTDAMIAWSRDHISALDIRHCGPAGHHAPEDQPEAIGKTIAQWLATQDLTTPDAH